MRRGRAGDQSSLRRRRNSRKRGSGRRASRSESAATSNATGPGWLLVGDAGHHKDFVVGDGISEALIQARSSAKAILEGNDETLERWWRERDVEALPLFFMSRDEGPPEPFGELQRVVMRKVAQRQDLRQRMFKVIDRELAAQEVFSPPQILAWALGAALRGRFGVLRDFAAMARKGADESREIARRRELLAALA